MKTLLTKNKVNNLSLPVTNDDMNDWINLQDTTTQRQVKDKLYYLGSTYDIARLRGIIARKASERWTGLSTGMNAITERFQA